MQEEEGVSLWAVRLATGSARTLRLRHSLTSWPPLPHTHSMDVATETSCPTKLVLILSPFLKPVYV